MLGNILWFVTGSIAGVVVGHFARQAYACFFIGAPTARQHLRLGVGAVATLTFYRRAGIFNCIVCGALSLPVWLYANGAFFVGAAWMFTLSLLIVRKQRAELVRESQERLAANVARHS
jgi:hypothetical protein